MKIVLDALLDLLMRVGFAAPAVYLCPAGDAGLHAMASEIAVDRFGIKPRLGLGVDRVRARADQRKIALEHNIQELRQFIETGFADDASDASDAWIILGDEFVGGCVRSVRIHRAEFVDLDQIVIEAVALLLE